MSAEVIDIRQAKTAKPALSASLTSVSKSFREELLRSESWRNAWEGKPGVQDYADFLNIHLNLRQTIDGLFDSLEGQSAVRNVFTGQIKTFDLNNFIIENKIHIQQLDQDLYEIQQHCGIGNLKLPPLAEELLAYMTRVKKMYSVALLGVLYMLDETLTHGGPDFARSIDKHLQLEGKSTGYLQGVKNHKQKFWAFKKSLNEIRDFQSQFNIVTAASFSYQIYRELLEAFLREENNIVYLR